MQWIKANWPWLVAFGVPLLLTIIATIVNYFGDPDHNPETPPPKWVKVLLIVADVLSWVSKSGKLTVPGASSPSAVSKERGYIRLDVLFGAVAFELGVAGVFLLGLLLAGCAGFKTPTYSTLTAIVKATDVAQVQLPGGCEATQNAAVDAAKDAPSARAAVRTVQDRCDAGLVGVEAVGKTAKTARDGVKDFSAAAKTPADVMKWAIGALDAYRNLIPLLSTLGVKLPEVK